MASGSGSTESSAWGSAIASLRPFRLDADGVAEFEDPERVARETLLRACDACPVDAITVWDAEGHQVVP